MYIKAVLRFLLHPVLLLAVHVSILQFCYEQLEVKDSIFFSIVSLTPRPGTNKEDVLNI